MKVTVVVTVRDEARTIQALLDALDHQTRKPDEIVIVDGGSTDGTVDELEHWAADRPSVVVTSVPGANIAAGRNAAIERASGPLIAVTDGGCTPAPEWLAALVSGFDAADIDVVMGFYRADPKSRFERLLDCVNLPDASEVDPETFMPSSRSVAFRKDTWRDAGGYPEWLAIGEDMYFNFRVRDAGACRVFAPAAVVRWRLRPTLRACVRQYFRYAEGDGRARMYPRRHLLRLATYAGALAILLASLRWPALLILLVAGGALRMVPAYRRAFRRLAAGEALLGLVALPLLEVVLDLAKMAGYLAGRLHRQAEPPADH